MGVAEVGEYEGTLTKEGGKMKTDLALCVVLTMAAGCATSLERGAFTFPNGMKYAGEYKDGLANGQGRATFSDGAKYVGEFRDGKRHGQGTFTWADGRKYVGEFKDGLANGQGTLTWADGRKYVGEFKDDMCNGQGTFTLPDGTKYVGEFKDNTYNGQGTRTSSDGAAEYVGEFKDGRSSISIALIEASPAMRVDGPSVVSLAPDAGGKRICMILPPDAMQEFNAQYKEIQQEYGDAFGQGALNSAAYLRIEPDVRTGKYGTSIGATVVLSLPGEVQIHCRVERDVGIRAQSVIDAGIAAKAQQHDPVYVHYNLNGMTKLISLQDLRTYTATKPHYYVCDTNREAAIALHTVRDVGSRDPVQVAIHYSGKRIEGIVFYQGHFAAVNFTEKYPLITSANCQIAMPDGQSFRPDQIGIMPVMAGEEWQNPLESYDQYLFVTAPDRSFNQTGETQKADTSGPDFEHPQLRKGGLLFGRSVRQGVASDWRLVPGTPMGPVPHALEHF